MKETPSNSIDCKELYARLSAVNLGNITEGIDVFKKYSIRFTEQRTLHYFLKKNWSRKYRAKTILGAI